MLAVCQSTLRRCPSLRLRSPLAGLILVLAAGCSAPPGTQGDDEATVPPFPTGSFPNSPAGSTQGSAPSGNNGSNTNGTSSSAANPGQTGEGNPNGAQLNNGAMMPAGANANASGNAGAGGSSAAAPMGAAGSGGIVSPGGQGGAAGSGSVGQEPPPPPQPPPITPPAGGCASGALFCENFDARPLGALVAGTNNLAPERNVAVIADPQRGRVLQASASSGFDGRAGFFLNGFSAPNNSFFGRMFVRVAQFPASAEFAHWVLVEATGPDRQELVRPVGGQLINRGGLQNFWAPGNDRGPSGDWTDHQASQAIGANGAWACVQWEMNANGSTMTVTVDGVAVPRTAHDGFAFPTFNQLWFGWVVFQAGTQPNQFDVRFDDIVLSTQPIGCN